MIEIPLNKGKVAFVDDEFAHLANWKWYASKDGNNWYAAHRFKIDDKKQGMMFMHWAVIGQPLNRKLHTDHRNGDGLLNTKDNLRHVTNRENQVNQRNRREGKTSSRYFGVHWAKRERKWRAQITINGKRKNLGVFVDEKDAANAYQNACKLIIGGRA